MGNIFIPRREFITGSAAFAAALGLMQEHAHAYPGRLRGGSASSVVKADVIVYGATPYGICAAVEVARNYGKVAICGGWREQHVGGMISGGLGGTDTSNKAVITGLAYNFLVQRVGGYYGRPTSGWPYSNCTVEPSVAELIFLQMLAQYSIPVYFSQGVSAVNMSGSTITGFHTVDGQQFIGKTFVDASMELDLAYTAGIPTKTGREANSLSNNYSGYAFSTKVWCNADGGTSYPGSTSYVVDPFVTPGTPSSGTINTVLVAPGNSTATAVGGADGLEQVFNMRMNIQRSGTGIQPMPSTPPPGYSSSNYEHIGRAFAAFAAAGVTYGSASASSYSAGTLFTFNSLPNNKIDLNNGQTDFIDCFNTNELGGLSYLQQTYTNRATIWTNHINYLLGVWYYLQHDTDSRIPAALQTYCQGFGYGAGEFLSPYSGVYGADPVGMPYCLYVRSPRRLLSGVGGAVLNGADMSAAAGTSCRISSNIGAVASYTEDCHGMQKLANGSSAPYNTIIEGGFDAGRTSPGAFPVPVEVMMPDVSVCTNLVVTSGLAATYQATSVTRIENTMMMLGQTAGQIALMSAKGGISVQTAAITNYSALSALLQSEDGSFPIDLNPVGT